MSSDRVHSNNLQVMKIQLKSVVLKIFIGAYVITHPWFSTYLRLWQRERSFGGGSYGGNPRSYLAFEGEIYQMFTVRDFKSKLLDDLFFSFLPKKTTTNYGVGALEMLFYLILPYLYATIYHASFSIDIAVIYHSHKNPSYASN